MKGTITYKNNEINSIEELLEHYGKNEFSSPFCSTIPLIELFYKNEYELEKIIPDYKSYICSFEYQTPVVKGKGKPSCTDLMIYTDENAYCIEAKRTEPAYQTVLEWLDEGNIDNRKLVLSGWIELINNKCGTKLECKDVKKFPYQLIHRFASACKIGQNMTSENVHLFYFFFDEKNESIEYYKNWLLELSEITNNSIDIKSFVFNIDETENYKSLEYQWNLRSGKLDLSDDVIQLLIEEKCMTIYRDELNLGETTWKKISKDEFYEELDKEESIENKKAQFMVENAMGDITRATKKVLMDYSLGMYKQSLAKVIAYLGIKSTEGQELLKSFNGNIREEIENAARDYNKQDYKVITEVEHILSSNGMNFDTNYKIIKENLPLVKNDIADNILKNFRSETPIYKETLNNCIFCFEDIIVLDDRAIQLVLRDIDQKTLTFALKGTSQKVQDKIFGNMSLRAVSMIKEDMEFYGPLRIVDVKAAQTKILQSIFRLEEKGDIVIYHGDATEFID